MSVPAHKQQSYRRGLWAEQRAALYLLCRGYKILRMRYKTPVGEIDLLARRGNVLAAIEVKARSTTENGLYAVAQRSQGRIERALQCFLAANPQYSNHDIRFDVIIYAGHFSITHLDNAWAART